MPKPTRVIVDCATGEQTVVELTDEEITQLEADKLAHEADRAQREAEAQAKAEAKASALAKLTKLGLTAEEAEALVK